MEGREGGKREEERKREGRGGKEPPLFFGQIQPWDKGRERELPPLKFRSGYATGPHNHQHRQLLSYLWSVSPHSHRICHLSTT